MCDHNAKKRDPTQWMNFSFSRYFCGCAFSHPFSSRLLRFYQSIRANGILAKETFFCFQLHIWIIWHTFALCLTGMVSSLKRTSLMPARLMERVEEQQTKKYPTKKNLLTLAGKRKKSVMKNLFQFASKRSAAFTLLSYHCQMLQTLFLACPYALRPAAP